MEYLFCGWMDDANSWCRNFESNGGVCVILIKRAWKESH
jgi:hypothetical protein